MACMVCIATLLCTLGCTPAPSAQVEGTINAVVEMGGYIYYVNGMGSAPGAEYEYAVTMGALCRMRPDGSNREVLLPMCIATFQIAGDEIYVVTLNSANEYVIGTCNLDGSNYQAHDQMIVGTFQYLYGNLYYQTEEGLVRTNSRCTQKKVLDTRTPASTAFLGGYLYCTYADENTTSASLERINLETAESEVLVNSECFLMGRGELGVYYLMRSDSILYFMNGETKRTEKMVFTPYAEYVINDLTGMAYCAGDETSGKLVAHNMHTGDKRTLNSYYCTNLVLTDQYVYFINGSDNNFLYRTALADGKTELVTASVPLSGRIYAVNGYIYYTSPNERSRIYRIDEQTLERVCIHYGE